MQNMLEYGTKGMTKTYLADKLYCRQLLRNKVSHFDKPSESQVDHYCFRLLLVHLINFLLFFRKVRMVMQLGNRNT